MQWRMVLEHRGSVERKEVGLVRWKPGGVPERESGSGVVTVETDGGRENRLIRKIHRVRSARHPDLRPSEREGSISVARIARIHDQPERLANDYNMQRAIESEDQLLPTLTNSTETLTRVSVMHNTWKKQSHRCDPSDPDRRPDG